MSKVLRFLVIGDLHGVIPKIHVDLNSIDAIIAPGDFCGDDVRIYYKKLFELRKENPLVEFDDVCPKWKQKLYDVKSLRKGKVVLNFLNSLGKPVFLVPGNWEPTSHENGKSKGDDKWQKLKSGFENLVDVENRRVNFKELSFVGHGSTSAPEDLEESYFRKVFRKLSSYLKTAKNPIILISHNVPYNTKLDKIQDENSFLNGKHWGSIISRMLIDEYQPMLCVGGHIHEGFGKTRLKKTVCINAGFGSEVNTVVEIDVNNGKVLNIEFFGENKV